MAEGVDLPEQATALREMGCTHGQGVAFSGPLDEYRLRRALTLGEYPVPRGAAEPVLAGGPPQAFAGGGAQTYAGGSSGPFATTPLP
ncbi:EAL domain-containing protein OS=Streptomyces alboniger OX=132473 GN=CP975_25300 PE=4 SV=1 [Streptomyces alboniger]